eukprot:gene14598-17260_t
MIELDFSGHWIFENERIPESFLQLKLDTQDLIVSDPINNGSKTVYNVSPVDNPNQSSQTRAMFANSTHVAAKVTMIFNIQRYQSIPLLLNLSSTSTSTTFTLPLLCAKFVMPPGGIKAFQYPVTPYQFDRAQQAGSVPMLIPGIQQVPLSALLDPTSPCVIGSMVEVYSGVADYFYDILAPCPGVKTLNVSDGIQSDKVSFDTTRYNQERTTIIDSFNIYPANNTVIQDRDGLIYAFVTASKVNSYFFLSPISPNASHPVSGAMKLVQTAPDIYFATYSMRMTLGLNLVTIDNTKTFSDPFYLSFASSPLPSNGGITDSSYKVADIGTLYNNTIAFSLEFTAITLAPHYLSLSSGEKIVPEVSYPYGIVGNSLQSYHYKWLFIGSTYDLSNSIIIGTEVLNPNYKPTESDSEPIVLKYSILARTDSTAVYQIRVTSKSGVQYILVGLYSMTVADLVSGTIYNGVFEKELPLLSSESSIIIYNRGGTPKTLLMNDIVDIGFDVARYQYLTKYQVTPSNFTKLYFAENNVDTTDKITSNRLYFNLTVIDKQYRPILTFEYMGTYKQPTSFQGNWDEHYQLYVIPFTLPMNLIDGHLFYKIHSISTTRSQLLYPLFGEQSLLKVHSQSGDLLPPMISQMNSYPSGSVSPSDQSFGWDLLIDETISGIKSVSINVTSDLDMFPRTFTLSNGAGATKNNFIIKIPIDPNVPCIGQVFSITSIELIDNADNIASTAGTFDPFIKIRYTDDFVKAFNITLNCGKATDTIAPKIDSISFMPEQVDVGSMKDEDRQLVVYLTASDDKQLSHRHNPVVFLETLNFQTFRIDCIHGEVPPETTENYKCVTILPYGFGQGLDTIYISVYGFVDSSLNMVGYASSDLRDKGLPYTLDTVFNRVPIITNSTSLTTNGGFLTLFGLQFGLNPVILTVMAEYNGDELRHDIVSMSGTMVVIYVQPVDSDIVIQITKGDAPSNRYLQSNETAETNVNSGQYTPTSTIDSFININIPYYVTSVLMDPDFSLLVDTDSGDISCKGGKKWMTAGRMAGIIIGAIGLGAVAATVAARTLYVKRKQRLENMALESKLNRIGSDKL